jgi:hypothetical protein
LVARPLSVFFASAGGALTSGGDGMSSGFGGGGAGGVGGVAATGVVAAEGGVCFGASFVVLLSQARLPARNTSEQVIRTNGLVREA